jgi:hypothetical protein
MVRLTECDTYWHALMRLVSHNLVTTLLDIRYDHPETCLPNHEAGPTGWET